MKNSSNFIKDFNELGYCVIDNTFELSKLNAFQQVLRKVVITFLKRFSKETLDKLENLSVDEGFIKLRQIDPVYASMVQRTISRTPEFFQLCSSEKIQETVRTLFKIDTQHLLYLLSNGIIFTTPNDSTNTQPSNFDLDWHNDVFSTIPRSRFLHIWAPMLHDATPEIGTLRILPKSHLEQVKQTINLEVAYNHRFCAEPEAIKKFDPISVNVKLGQALFFDGRVIHASGANTSNQVRCTMLGLFHDIENENFYPVAPGPYKYINETPEHYFYEIYQDERALPAINDLLESESTRKKASL